MPVVDPKLRSCILLCFTDTSWSGKGNSAVQRPKLVTLTDADIDIQRNIILMTDKILIL